MEASVVSNVKQLEKECKIIKLTFKTLLKTAILPDLHPSSVTDNLADKQTLQFQQKQCWSLLGVKIKTLSQLKDPQ